MTDQSTEARRLWFVMVLQPDGKWKRTGSPYSTKAVAHDWLPYVKKVWYRWPARVQSIALRRGKNGKVLPSVLRKLDEVYNLEVKQ